MRWERFHSAGLTWVARVERAIVRLDHPEQGAFVALTNAIEFQLEVGAEPETLRHLVHALHAFVTAVGIKPKDVHVPDDPDAFVRSLAPAGPGSAPP